jgi:hypothetical protein
MTAPAPVTCPHYAPLPGVRRCRHYLPNGACDRPDEFLCVEWLKGNAHRAPVGGSGEDAMGASPLVDRFPERWLSLFDHGPAPLSQSRRLARARLAPPSLPVVRSFTPPPVPPTSAEDVAALAERYAETQLETEELGSVWIVAEPTGADRLELTYRDAATLAAVCAAFPGARVVSLERAKKSS